MKGEITEQELKKLKDKDKAMVLKYIAMGMVKYVGDKKDKE